MGMNFNLQDKDCDLILILKITFFDLVLIFKIKQASNSPHSNQLIRTI